MRSHENCAFHDSPAQLASEYTFPSPVQSTNTYDDEDDEEEEAENGLGRATTDAAFQEALPPVHVRAVEGESDGEEDEQDGAAER